MAPSKRKRRAEDWTKAKRHKQADDRYWSIKYIVAERKTGGSLEYLVDWDGIDEDTGLPYGEADRSWIPAQDVTTLARNEWEVRRTLSKEAAAAILAQADKKSDEANRSSRSSSYSVDIEGTPVKRGRGRPRKQLAPENAGPSKKQLGTRPRGRPRNPTTPEVADNSIATTPSSVRSPTASHSSTKNTQHAVRDSSHDTATRAPSPRITIDPRNPSSLNGFLYISQLASQTPLSSLSDSSASQPHAASSFRSTGVVYESEDDRDESGYNPSASYVPNTQATTNLSLEQSGQSRLSFSSTHEASAIFTSLEDSAPSPALSIPETEPEAEHTPQQDTLDYETQAHPYVEHQRVIPDTCEPIGETSSTVESAQVHEAQPSTQEEFANAPQSTAEALVAQVPENSAQEQGALPGTSLNSSAREIPSTTQQQQNSQPRLSPRLDERQQGERQQDPQADSGRQSTLASTIEASLPQPESWSSEDVSAVCSIEQSANSTARPESHSWSGLNIDQSSPSFSAEQHAQVVSSAFSYNTQQEHPEELDSLPAQHSTIVRSGSRHDSSQNSPGPSGSLAKYVSPTLQPPKLSIGTIDAYTHAPSRPRTPLSLLTTPMSSGERKSAMAEEIMATFMAQAEEQAAASAKKREIEKQRERQLRESERERSRSAALERTPGLEEQAAHAARGLEHQSVQAISEAGTRSPSTIPNHATIPPVPTSLRTVATSVPDPVPPVLHDQANSRGFEALSIGRAPQDMSRATEDVDMDEAQYSGDDEDEDESFLNDDLQLQGSEYIVPLPFHGRQADAYRDICKDLIKEFESFAQNPSKAQQNIETAIYKLRAVETHVDLIWGGNTTPQPTDVQQEKDEHLAQWSYDFSIKFKFLKALLSKLQDRNLHIILLIEREDNVRFFNIVESFLRGAHFSFESPVTDRAHVADDGLGKDKNLLKITILSSTSNMILREAQLIVCLDGKPDAIQIRSRPWGIKSGFEQVPLLHLVIPRTIGHLDLYLSNKISTKGKLRTTVATLSQWTSNHEIGHAVNYVPPKSYEVGFAEQTLQYLLPSEEEPPLSEWPLPALGNIKDIVEYQSSQQPLETANLGSPLLGSIAAGKRPLLQDGNSDDPAKRMRFTPQQSAQTNTSHVSDSTSGASQSMERRFNLLKQENRRLWAELEDWKQRQFTYEEMTRTHRLLKDEKEAAEKKLADSEERNQKLRDQLNSRTADNVELRTQLKEHQSLNALSDDAKIATIAAKNAEIATLKEEIAQQAKSVKDAADSKKSSEGLLNYVNDRLREQSSEASTLREEKKALQAEHDRLKRVEKAQPLAQEHFRRQHQHFLTQNENLRSQVAILTKQLQVKAQEDRKAKAEKDQVRTTRGVGAGTRAASVGARTPRPGSRASSPMPGNGKDRVANLRNEQG